jgi:hypothetical protein
MSDDRDTKIKYKELERILLDAYNQAAKGKGYERHGEDNRWDEQIICKIPQVVGTGFNEGQAIKKIIESHRLPKDMRIKELLGAIVYVASAIYVIEQGINE